MNTKNCPMCAETIQIEANICRFCGARFEIKSAGYCTNCHEMRNADENSRCVQCGSELMDLHIESTLIRPATPTPNPSPMPIQPPRKKSRTGIWAIGILLIAAVCIVSGAILYSINPTVDVAPTKTRPTPIIPSTPKPPTPIPTRTSTPMPVTITFDTIGDYPEGQLVILSGILEMFKSTWCGTECGLLLAEYSNFSNKITIFVRVAAKGVEPSPNQMKALPDPYGKWDIVICLNDGTYAYIDQRITVTGRICKTTDGDPCISSITKIELEK